MDKSEQIYRDLQQHLDKQPIGYPATESGVEIRILKRLFTPEEALLALHLGYKPASVEQICESAKGSGASLAAIESILANMVQNGAVGCVERGGKPFFFALPLVPGMFEFQVNRIDIQFANDVNQYSDETFGPALLRAKTPFMRTIPVEKSISIEHHVTTFDQISELINDAAEPLVVVECICRKSAAITKGEPCKKTSRQETCTVIGDLAKQYIKRGVGRVIDKKEALEIARMAEAEGLVFQVSNALKPDAICTCCGCCCGGLHVHKMLPKPLEFWRTNYHVSVQPETCTGCEICVERCQVDAVTVDESGMAVVNLERCIGCGNCVATCPTGSMALIRKEEEVVPPRDMEDYLDVIMAHKKETLGKTKPR